MCSPGVNNSKLISLTYRPIIRIEKFLLLIAKETATLIEQTKTKPRETLGCKVAKPRECVSFDIPSEMRSNTPNHENRSLLELSSLENQIFVLSNLGN